VTQVYRPSGKLITTATISNLEPTTINVGAWSKGLYLFTLKQDNNMFWKRVIVE
jgi:hypothetical protein